MFDLFDANQGFYAGTVMSIEALEEFYAGYNGELTIKYHGINVTDAFLSGDMTEEALDEIEYKALVADMGLDSYDLATILMKYAAMHQALSECVSYPRRYAVRAKAILRYAAEHYRRNER